MSYKKNKSLKTKVLSGSFLTMIFLLGLGITAILALRSISNTNEWVNHTHEAIGQAIRVKEDAMNMETGMRGFLLSGKESFLEPYNQGLSDFSKAIKTLQSKVSDNPGQVEKMGEVEKIIKEWVSNVTEPAIELRRKIGDAPTMNDVALLVGKKEGKKYFDKFRSQIGRFIEVEEVLLRQREAEMQTSSDLDTIRKNAKWVIHTHNVIAEARGILNSAIDMETGLRGYLLAGQEEFLEPYRSGKNRFDTNLNKLQETVSDNPPQVRLLSQAQDTLSEWDSNVANKMISLRRSIGDAPTMDNMADLVAEARGKTYFDQFRTLIDEFIAAEEKLMTIRQSDAETTRMVSVWTIVVGILVSVCISLLYSLRLSSNLTGHIHKFLHDIRKNAEKLDDASHDLSENSRELSGYAAEQASSIEETSSSMEEVSGIVRNNAQLAKESSEQSYNVNRQMAELSEAMSKISDSNEQSDGLVDIINEIGAKTEVIDEIVFQTKLLSFNASVEAERAGEHGRGFAVVAQEVGNLAQMSGKAAMEIAGIVQNSTSKAGQIIKENSNRVTEGTRIVRDILTQSETVAQSSSKISEASNEQSRGISQIGIAIENINSATQKTASIAEDAASSSMTLNQQSSNLIRYVNEMHGYISGRVGSSSEQDEHLFRTENSEVTYLDERRRPQPTPSRMQARSETKHPPLRKATGTDDLSYHQEEGDEDKVWKEL